MMQQPYPMQQAYFDPMAQQYYGAQAGAPAQMAALQYFYPPQQQFIPEMPMGPISAAQQQQYMAAMMYQQQLDQQQQYLLQMQMYGPQ